MRTRGKRTDYKKLAEGDDLTESIPSVDLTGSDNEFSSHTVANIKLETDSDDDFTNAKTKGQGKNVPTGKGKCMPKRQYLQSLVKTTKISEQNIDDTENYPGPSNSSSDFNSMKKATSKKFSKIQIESDTDSQADDDQPKHKVPTSKFKQSHKQHDKHKATSTKLSDKYKKKKLTSMKTAHKHLSSDSDSDIQNSSKPTAKRSTSKHVFSKSDSDSDSDSPSDKNKRKNKILKANNDSSSDSSCIQGRSTATKKRKYDTDSDASDNNSDSSDSLSSTLSDFSTNCSKTKKFKARNTHSSSAETISFSGNDSDSDYATNKKILKKKNKTKKRKASKSTTSSDTDDDLKDLNDYTVLTSRDLKKHKRYKLLSIKISKEYGFNGPYKQAVAKFEDKSHPDRIISVRMPKPVSNYTSKQLEKLKIRIKNKKNPWYVVKKITTRQRADGKGSYDIVHFKWY